jgi:predicted DNA-binding ribbon-helix-helix protein
MTRGKGMKSPVVKRSIVVGGHKTSVSLEDEFWSGLREIAKARRQTVSELVGALDGERKHSNLSSALRLFVLDFYRRQIAGLAPLPAAPDVQGDRVIEEANGRNRPIVDGE